MSMQDSLADALSTILNAEKANKEYCMIKPTSKTIKTVLELMNKQGYVGDFEFVDDNRGGIIKLHLLGKVNKCGAIKPRFNFEKDEIEKYERRYLPAKGFGIIIVSTSKGIMLHNEAKDKNLGGVLLAYVY